MRRILLATFFLGSVSLCYSQTAKEHYTKASKLKTENKCDEAVNAYREATRLDPSMYDAWYELGWCLNDMKDYGGALYSLRKAKALKPDYVRVYFEMGWAFEKTSKTDSAIKYYNSCLVMKSDYSSASRQLGYIAYHDEKYELALQHFSRYEYNTKTSITDYLYWYRKGFIQNATKDYKGAKESLIKSLELKKDYFNSYLELGFAHSRLKENDEAIAQYSKAIELDPKSHVPYNGIGEVYRDNIKNLDEAMRWYKKSLAISPNERKANFGIGYCLNSQSKYNDAIAYLKKAIESEETYTAAYVEIGYSYYMIRSNSLALENLNRAMSLNPSNENSRYYAGLVYIDQRNKTMAQKMVDDLKKLNSKNASTLQEKVSKMN